MEPGLVGSLQGNVDVKRRCVVMMRLYLSRPTELRMSGGIAVQVLTLGEDVYPTAMQWVPVAQTGKRVLSDLYALAATDGKQSRSCHSPYSDPGNRYTLFVSMTPSRQVPIDFAHGPY